MPSFIAAGSGRVVGVRRGLTHFERRLSLGVAPSLALAAATLLVCPVAEAHFKINMPMSWMSQDTVGGPQKNGPCAAMPNTALGDSPGAATKMVTVFQAGQTIPISVTATIAHPGWWRVALVEGASSTQTLTTLPDPVAQTGTNCTPAIMANPVWSSTQPIVADGLPAGSVATTQQKGTQTLQVKLPDNANCTNASPCTLQVIMVMTDHPKTDCYYHHCADIVIGSSTDGGTPRSSDAAATDGGGTGGSNATGTGGFVGTGGSPGSGTGGLPGTGGLSGTGGSSGTGGFVGTGGSPGSGGLASSGGAGPSAAATGGVPGSGSGGSGTAGPGTTSQSGSGSSGGCSLASGGKSSSAGVSAAGLVALALMRRRPRPRS